MLTPAAPPVRRARRKSAVSKSFCEFFAGIGLVREGLSKGGWDCVYANDIDAKKLAIYAARFGWAEHLHQGDVWDTAEVIARIPPRPFLATASFPCTDLSLAGHWRGLRGSESSAFFGFVQALDSLNGQRPPLISLENVTGFLSSRDGKDFSDAATSLAELGYWLDALIVDAKHFVPQSRPRVFIVGVHRDQVQHIPSQLRPRSLFSADSAVPAPDRVLRPRRLTNLMENTSLPTGWLGLALSTPNESRVHVSQLIDLDDAQDWWDEVAVTKHRNMMSERHARLVDGLLRERGVHVGTIFRRRRHGAMRAEVRFDGLAGCLRTPRGGSARQIVIVLDHGRLRMRWMNAREYARLQGADDFPLLDNTIQMLYGFGDAVCVPVIRWLDEQILSPIYAAIAASAIQ